MTLDSFSALWPFINYSLLPLWKSFVECVCRVRRCECFCGDVQEPGLITHGCVGKSIVSDEKHAGANYPVSRLAVPLK